MAPHTMRDAVQAKLIVMPGLVPGIHAFYAARQDVDGRDKPDHDAST
jgi:hypothetical protein